MFEGIKKSSLFFLPLSISLYLGRLIRENFDIKKKTFFYIRKVFIISKNDCMGENLFSFKKPKLYVIGKDFKIKRIIIFMIRKRKKLKEKKKDIHR